MNVPVLLAIAVIPPLGYLYYINRLDRVEPEPFGLILKTMLLGMAAVIPAAVIEMALGAVPGLALDAGVIPASAAEGLTRAAVHSFLVIAPVEEGVKLAVVLLFAWKNANFNEENDGIVYTGAAAIGFSLLENVFYVLQYGLGTGIMRAVTSIPLHTFTGVLMGYFVGIAKFAPAARARGASIAAGFIIACIVHAVYDTLVLSGTGAGLLVVPLVIALAVFGVIYMKKGALLSLRRWGGAAPVPVHVPKPSAQESGPGTYKIVIARLLFGLCALFWGLLIIGILTAAGDESATTGESIIGGMLLTFIPIGIGVMLELSYRRQKQGAAA